jgi:acetyl-CoA carboxylase carboxyl transferase subunit beta
MVDMVVHRHKLRATLAELCRVLSKTAKPVSALESLSMAELPPPAPETWTGQA